MTVRNVKKNLAAQQDLLPGVGPYQQVRRGVVVDVDGPAKSYIELWKEYCGEAYVGTFEDGFVTRPGCVAVSLALGKAYRYTAPAEVSIPANSPVDLNWVELSSSVSGVQAFEALRRSYAEAGYNLVDGSFESGGTLNSSIDVLLHSGSVKAYSGSGPYPQVVAPNTNPTAGGYTDRSGILAGAGTIRSGRFALSDFISMRDFGAGDDPTADYSAALRNAIAHARDNGIKLVMGVPCRLSGVIRIYSDVTVYFGRNQIIAEPSLEFQPDQGSGFYGYNIRMGINRDQKPNRSLCYFDGQKRFQLAGDKTFFHAVVTSTVRSSGRYVILDATTNADGAGAGAASVAGVEVKLWCDSMAEPVLLRADNTLTGGICYVNSNDIALYTAGSQYGIKEQILQSTGSAAAPAEISSNYYHIEYQTASTPQVSKPLLIEGEKSQVSGVLWDLHRASNTDNVIIKGKFVTIIGAGFPTEESGRLVYTGEGLNMVGGTGGTPRSRIYSLITERTHCKYLGSGRTTPSLMSTPYTSGLSVSEQLIKGSDYTDGTLIKTVTLTRTNGGFNLDGDTKLVYEAAGKTYSGKTKIGFLCRINGTNIGGKLFTLPVTAGDDSRDFHAKIIISINQEFNRAHMSLLVNGFTYTTFMIGVDVSNGATVEIFGLGGEAVNSAAIYTREMTLSYKYA